MSASATAWTGTASATAWTGTASATAWTGTASATAWTGTASATAWTAFNDLYVVFLTVFGAMALSRRRWPTQLLLFAALIGLVTALKVATGVLRPDGSDRRSFPSGHAAAAFFVAALSRFRPVVTIWAGLASVARVVLRRHTWLDIGVGATLGALFGTIA